MGVAGRLAQEVPAEERWTTREPTRTTGMAGAELYYRDERDKVTFGNPPPPTQPQSLVLILSAELKA